MRNGFLEDCYTRAKLSFIPSSPLPVKSGFGLGSDGTTLSLSSSYGSKTLLKLQKPQVKNNTVTLLRKTHVLVKISTIQRVRTCKDGAHFWFICT